MVRLTVKGTKIMVLSTEELVTDKDFLQGYFEGVNLEMPFKEGEALFTSTEGADYDLEYIREENGELIFMPHEEGILEDN